jgi:hypothetical protein
MTGLRPLLLGLAIVLTAAAPCPAQHGSALREQCAATARAVGYPAPCPALVRQASSARAALPDGELEIIGPGKRYPNTAVSRRGWVVGSSSTAQGEHLVLTASLLDA